MDSRDCDSFFEWKVLSELKLADDPKTFCSGHYDLHERVTDLLTHMLDNDSLKSREESFSANLGISDELGPLERIDVTFAYVSDAAMLAWSGINRLYINICYFGTSSRSA